jgi:hypothetical protein
MFDLERSIAEWRKQMLAAGIKTPVPLEELESHLRDDVEQQVQSGLSEHQAFETAVERIGQASSLTVEFKKVNGTDESRKRKRAGRIFAVLLCFYSMVIVRVLVANDLTSSERFSGFASLVTMLFAIYVAWQFIPRFFPIITNKALQSVVGVVGGISGVSWFIAFARFILPRFDFTPGQLIVAICWASVPVMVLPTISFLGIGRSESPQFTKTTRS